MRTALRESRWISRSGRVRLGLLVVVVGGLLLLLVGSSGATGSGLALASAPPHVIAYVVNHGAYTVTPIDVATNEPGVAFPIGPNPEGIGVAWGIAITPDGKTAYVPGWNSNSVTPIDLATNTPGSVINPVGGNPAQVAITPDGTTAYVTNQGSNSVTPIDVATNAIGPSIVPATADGNPWGIAITPDGKTAYVASRNAYSVTPIDLATKTPGTTILVGHLPMEVAITPDGKTAYVTNNGDNTVTPITVATNTPGDPIPVGASPYGVAITPDGKTAYVTNTTGNSVTPITVATNTATDPIPVGKYPHGIAITPDGTTAYVTNAGDDSVTPITVATNTPGDPITVGDAPIAIAITAIPTDTTAPSTTIALTPASPNGLNGWYTKPVGVTVSATDNDGGPGVGETHCVLDPATPPASFDAIPAGCPYSGAGADVTTDGQHVLYAASEDVAGNKEAPVSSSFMIDKTIPLVAVTQVNGSTVAFPFSTSVNLASIGGTCGMSAGDLAPVSVTINTLASVPASASCAADGTWRLTLTTPLSVAHSYAFLASQSDAAGNTGVSTSKTVTISSAPVFSGITFVNTVQSGRGKVPNCTTTNPFKTGTSDVNTFPNAVCSSDGNAPSPSTFSWEVELATGTPGSATPVTNAGAPITVIVTKVTTSATKGRKHPQPSLLGGTSQTIATGSSATTVPFKVGNIGGGNWIQVTCTVTIGAQSYTLEMQVH